MDGLLRSTTRLIGTITGTHIPKARPFRPNRVDASPNLIQYHDPSNGPKPRPQKTELLPLRTLTVSLSPLDDFVMDQTNAHYEETDTIPAAAVGQNLGLDNITHWCLIHPLQPTQVRALSSRVLEDLRVWIRESEDKYVGTCKLVRGFQEVRSETLEDVQTELRRRGLDGRVGNEEGYLGKWEELDENGEVVEYQVITLSRRTSTMEQFKPRTGPTALTAEGLAAADEMAMFMVEEARRMEEAMEWNDVDLEDIMDFMEECGEPSDVPGDV